MVVVHRERWELGLTWEKEAVVPRASKRAYEEFVKSLVWEDLRQLLSDRLMLVRNDLEADTLPQETQKLRGEAASIRFMLALPDRLISEYDSLIKEEEALWQAKGQGQEQEQEQKDRVE
jgi:hypothetical protein